MKKILILVVVAFCATAFSDLKIKTEIEYYNFSGATKIEMLRSLNSNGIRHGRRVYHGYATYHINWRFHPEMKNGQCSMNSVDIELKNTLTLPKWNKPWFGKVDKKSEAKLTAYLQALDYHERGHEKISIDGAKQMYQALKSIAPEPTCQQLEKKAHQLARVYMQQIQRKQRDYDVVTDHGRTQGAYLR